MKKPEEMNALDVTDALFRYFNANKGYTYQLTNAYVFKWESDFFCIAASGFSYEIEVKVSRGDFFADFNKKKKHRILAEENRYHVKRTNVHPGIDNWHRMARWKRLQGVPGYTPYSRIQIIDVNTVRPNKFLYAVPEGLVQRDEVPEYAGLVYVKDDRRYRPAIVKKPPVIHSVKNDFTKILLKKYYWAYLNSLGQKAAGKNFDFPEESA